MIERNFPKLIFFFHRYVRNSCAESLILIGKSSSEIVEKVFQEYQKKRVSTESFSKHLGLVDYAILFRILEKEKLSSPINEANSPHTKQFELANHPFLRVLQESTARNE